MKRATLAGLALAGLYVTVTLATNVFGTHTVRPLFDAIGPPPAYRWVKPPPDFAAGNVRSKPIDVSFGVKPDDLPPAGASEDSQFVFNLPKGSIPPADPDVTVKAHIAPLDPDTLGPLPGGKFADGNTYRITFNYDPSGKPAVVATPGSVLLTVPVPAEGVVFSEDGKAWRTINSAHASANAVGADMPGGGYYLAVVPERVGFTKTGGGAGRLLVPILITVVVAGALLGVPIMLRRRRPMTAAEKRQRQRQQQRRAKRSAPR
jgi:hypothetical protein